MISFEVDEGELVLQNTTSLIDRTPTVRVAKQTTSEIWSLRLRSRACLLRLISLATTALKTVPLTQSYKMKTSSTSILNISMCDSGSVSQFHNSGAKTLKNPFDFGTLPVRSRSQHQILTNSKTTPWLRDKHSISNLLMVPDNGFVRPHNAVRDVLAVDFSSEM